MGEALLVAGQRAVESRTCGKGHSMVSTGQGSVCAWMGSMLGSWQAKHVKGLHPSCQLVLKQAHGSCMHLLWQQHHHQAVWLPSARAAMSSMQPVLQFGPPVLPNPCCASTPSRMHILKGHCSHR